MTKRQEMYKITWFWSTLLATLASRVVGESINFNSTFYAGSSVIFPIYDRPMCDTAYYINSSDTVTLFRPYASSTCTPLTLGPIKQQNFTLQIASDTPAGPLDLLLSCGGEIIRNNINISTYRKGSGNATIVAVSCPT